MKLSTKLIKDFANYLRNEEKSIRCSFCGKHQDQVCMAQRADALGHQHCGGVAVILPQRVEIDLCPSLSLFKLGE